MHTLICFFSPLLLFTFCSVLLFFWRRTIRRGGQKTSLYRGSGAIWNICSWRYRARTNNTTRLRKRGPKWSPSLIFLTTLIIMITTITTIRIKHRSVASFQGFALHLTHERTRALNKVADGRAKISRTQDPPWTVPPADLFYGPAAVNQVDLKKKKNISDGDFTPRFHWSYGYPSYFPRLRISTLYFLAMEIHFGASQELFQLLPRILSVPRWNEECLDTHHFYYGLCFFSVNKYIFI